MKKADAEHCLRELKRMGVGVEAELDRLFVDAARGPAGRMYNMLRYFLGFVDADFKPTSGSAGKRLRSSLCLLIAEAYGAQKKAFEAAIAIELFHNFTLIHDDVADRDEIRRGRPTVWKLWGSDHAINAGDVQCLLAVQYALRAAKQHDAGMRIAEVLLQAFVEVGEGQYLDFELSDAPLDANMVDEKRSMLMIEKKTGALVRVAAEAAGMAAGQTIEECALLREYGASLGIAYQIADDYASIWNAQIKTGKDAHGDIREHKRTLPFLFARTQADAHARQRLDELYSLQRQLSDTEVAQARAIIDTPAVRTYTRVRAQEYADRARAAAHRLSISEEAREILAGIVDALIPDIA